MKPQLLRVLGYSRPKIAIFQFVSQNGNKVNREQLISEVMASQGLERKSVLYHIREMVEKKELIENGDCYSLSKPLTPSLGDNWKLAGAPLAISFFIMSYLEGNPIFMISSLVFILYSFSICIEEILYYGKRLHKKLL